MQAREIRGVNVRLLPLSLKRELFIRSKRARDRPMMGLPIFARGKCQFRGIFF